MIKMTDINLVTVTGTKIYLDIDIFRFIKDEDLFNVEVEVEIENNGEHEHLEIIDLNEFNEIVINHSDLQRIAFNWIFKNVELIQMEIPFSDLN